MIRALEIAGVLLVGLALSHAAFPAYFRWREELASLQPITRQVHQVHTFFIALTVLLMGLLCLTSAEALVSTTLGRRLSAGLACFWGCRLIAQFFAYTPKVWRGKKFETRMHILFSILWLFLFATFGLAALAGRSSANGSAL